MRNQSEVVTNHVVAQDNLGDGPQPNAITLACRIRDFMRMNPPIFYGAKVD